MANVGCFSPNNLASGHHPSMDSSIPKQGQNLNLPLSLQWWNLHHRFWWIRFLTPLITSPSPMMRYPPLTPNRDILKIWRVIRRPSVKCLSLDDAALPNHSKDHVVLFFQKTITALLNKINPVVEKGFVSLQSPGGSKTPAGVLDELKGSFCLDDQFSENVSDNSVIHSGPPNILADHVTFWN